MSAEFCEDGFDKMFGLWARDEHGWSDAEGEAVELLLAGDVLDRLTGQAAEDSGFIGCELFRCESAIGVGVERGAREAGGVEEENERVAVGVGAEVRGRAELAGGACEGGAERGGDGCQLSVLCCRLLTLSCQVTARTHCATGILTSAIGITRLPNCPVA